MQGCAPDYLTGHIVAEATSGLARSFSSQTIPAAHVDRLGPEDLFAAGQTACHLGAAQLLDRAIAASDRCSWAAPTGAADDEIDHERCLATGYAACFWGALMLASSDCGTQVPRESLVTADVALNGFATQAFGLTVALSVSLPGLDQHAAAALVQQAHEICPYPHMSRSSIDVRLAA